MMDSQVLKYQPRPKTREAKERIIRFLTEADIKLSADEIKILARWEKADLLMRQKIKTWDEIVEIISDEFQVSSFTADSDITSAMAVFARSRKINRKYLGHLHIERIEKMIRKIEAAWFQPDEDGKIKIDEKKVTALKGMYESLTYQMNSLPEDADYKTIQPPTFIFNLTSGKTFEAPLGYLEALKGADKIIDITHEDFTGK